MNQSVPIALVFASIWGLAVSVFIHKFRFGDYLRRELTWLTVILGVGGVLALAAFFVPLDLLLLLLAMFALAGAPVVGGCILNKQMIDTELTAAEKKIAVKRLANNVIAALEDIIALCLLLRRTCTDALKAGGAGVVELSQLLSAVIDIESKARAAKGGEYE